jgi:hypothetical protein
MTKIITFSPENPNGIERDMTAEEQAQHDADTTNSLAFIQADKDAKDAKEVLKTSAKAKLVAGEALTEEEANTIVL